MRKIGGESKQARCIGSLTGETDAGADYTPDEIEFMLAMERYRRQTKHEYPTYAEALRVAKSLGWRKEPTL